MKNKISILMLVVVIVATILMPMTTMAAQSGTTGELTWNLDDSGTLTISGTGKMPDYSSSSPAPWYTYRDSIKNIVVENGVLNLGSEAFSGCINAESVAISDSVEALGKIAFDSCRIFLFQPLFAPVWQNFSIGSLSLFLCIFYTYIK